MKESPSVRLFRELPENVRSVLTTRDYAAAEQACPNGVRIGYAMKETVRLLG